MRTGASARESRTNRNLPNRDRSETGPERPGDAVAESGKRVNRGPSELSARDRIALAAGRSTGWASKVTGRGAGTQISGRVMLAIAPDLLADVARGRRVAIVSATNGKTTTTRLLAEALRANDTAVVSNHTGANMPAGVAAALGRDADASVAVLEVDERWVPRVVDPLDTELLVLGNLHATSSTASARCAASQPAGATCAPRTRSWRSWPTPPIRTSCGRWVRRVG